VDNGNIRVWCRKFLEFLPPLNYNCFVFLVAFLRDVVSQGNYNRWGETDALVTLSAGEDDVGFVLSCVFVLIFYV
jgi:hypothetical protein